LIARRESAGTACQKLVRDSDVLLMAHLLSPWWLGRTSRLVRVPCLRSNLRLAAIGEQLGARDET